MSFLQKLTNAIIANHTIDFKDTAIILPNRRAAKLLRQSMANQLQTAFFSPAFFTIDNFIEKLSPYKKKSPMDLLLTLYQTINESQQQEKSFYNFLSWGSVFIQDINEIDMQLANAHDIFTNLSEIKEIDNLFLKASPSSNTLSYVEFYKSLYQKYVQFCDVLKKEGYGYPGFIYRDVATHIEQYAEQHPYKRYIFAGFNMFSPAELKIASYYKENFQAEFYFDLDTFYYGNKHQNSYMVQQMQITFNKLGISPENISWISDDYRDIEKEITVTSISKQMSQVLYAAELLQKMPQEELDKTAVVLADESLFLPFIHTYNQRANYTMGYPMHATAAYNLFHTLINTAKNSERFQNKDNNKNSIYYHKDLLAFFRSPIIQEWIPLINNDGVTSESIISQMINKNRIFFEYEEIDALKTVHFPMAKKHGADFYRELVDFFNFLCQQLPEERQDFYSIPYLIQNLKETEPLINKMDDIVPDFDLISLDFILSENLKTISIPLSGTPESGLQVMGLLETRTLDFKNIIMLSVNEGTLPKGRSQNSLIMHDIKQHYNLPTFQYRDAVFAYHFFRLLQHAENIHLLYNSDTSDSLSEKSRFINQLAFEIKRQDYPIHFKTETLSPPLSKNIFSPLSIKKNQQIIETLRQYRYSPTALNTYLSCPLRFYLEKIARIQQPTTINETIESSIVGTIIHAVLEDLYTELKGKAPQYKTIIQKYTQAIDTIVNQKFEKENFQAKDLNRGKLFLACEVIKKNLLAYFRLAQQDFEQNFNDIIGTEIELSANIDIQGSPISLYGKSDRVDCREQCITILDYKTGYVNADKLQIKPAKESKKSKNESVSQQDELDILTTDPEYEKLFQLMMYAYLYKKDTSAKTGRKTDHIRCGIISFQELMKKNGTPILYAKVPDEEITSDIIHRFERILTILLESILDEKTPFEQTKNDKHCKFCDYKFICHK